MAAKKPFFKPVPTKVSFPESEAAIIEFWKANKVFEKSFESRPKDNPYSFYDGPPFVTGLPHYGHLLGSIAKDLVPRYQTMKGKRVRRVWGWDCHGLPIEEKTERKLGLNNRRDIEKIGVSKFLDACRDYVAETSAEWNWYVDRIGRWVDMDNAYRTMNLDFMESVIWAFKQLYDKGLVYEGTRTLLYCTRCGTPVSKFEIAMDDSYAEMEDPAVTVEFKVKTKGEFEGVRILAWTTTPWTLPSNRGLVVDPKAVYVEFKSKVSGNQYVAAEKRLTSVLDKDEAKILRRFKGQKLVGLSYEPPYKFVPANQNDFKIYTYPGMVNMEEGTGIVHSAPGFGEIDTQMGIEYGLTLMMTIDDEGKFLPIIKPWAGVYVKKADEKIIEDLKKRDLLFRVEKITHRYPYCYRCQTPLLYRTVKAWFIDIQKIKKQMLKHNDQIQWVPDHFKKGRFKYTVEEAPDWCVSRTRYWATVMPIWRCSRCQEIKVVGSIAEIEKNSIKKVKVTDLHRTGVDEIKFKCQCGGVMNRIPEVLDVWFESGSMPYGEHHYPFDHKKEFEAAFPADYIVEYVAQIRAWFYYLHAISTALFDSPSFKNVVVTGTMMGTDGRKMSKSYGNYPDPKGVLEEYGGDALRLYLMNSPLMVAEDVSMTKGEEFREQVKTVLIPYWNSVSFWVSFANLAEFKPSGSHYPRPTQVLNQWIIARADRFIAELDQALSGYQIPTAVRLIHPLVDDLSTWYIRRSKEPFRIGDQESLQTLYAVLIKVTKGIAPIVPFVAEEVYQLIGRSLEGTESVHLADYPEAGKLTKTQQKLLDEMARAREIVSLAHSARKEAEIKVRQPLAKLSYGGKGVFSSAVAQVIAAEVNVKKVVFDHELAGGEVKLETKLTTALVEEGKARDLIREIQQARKSAGCDRGELVELVTDYWPKDKKLADQVKEVAKLGKVTMGDKLKIRRR